jgi:hypothetical protein
MKVLKDDRRRQKKELPSQQLLPGKTMIDHFHRVKRGDL